MQDDQASGITIITTNQYKHPESTIADNAQANIKTWMCVFARTINNLSASNAQC